MSKPHTLGQLAALFTQAAAAHGKGLPVRFLSGDSGGRWPERGPLHCPGEAESGAVVTLDASLRPILAESYFQIFLSAGKGGGA